MNAGEYNRKIIFERNLENAKKMMKKTNFLLNKSQSTLISFKVVKLQEDKENIKLFIKLKERTLHYFILEIDYKHIKKVGDNVYTFDITCGYLSRQKNETPE